MAYTHWIDVLTVDDVVVDKDADPNFVGHDNGNGDYDYGTYTFPDVNADHTIVVEWTKDYED